MSFGASLPILLSRPGNNSKNVDVVPKISLSSWNNNI
jgi:hypothetical protein